MSLWTIYEKYKDSILGPAFVLPTLTGIAYIIAYSFETTYLAYFSVGHQFISITVNIFILSICTAALILVYMAGLFGQLTDVVVAAKKGRQLSRVFWRNTMTVVPLSMITVSLGLYFYADGRSLALLALMPIIPFILLIIIVAAKKQMAQHQTNNKVLRRILNSANINVASLQLFLIQPMVYILLATCVAISTGVIGGRLYSSTRTNYLTYSYEDTEYVLIREYESKLVFTSIDSNKKLSGKVLVINPKEKPIILKTMKVNDHLR